MAVDALLPSESIDGPNSSEAYGESFRREGGRLIRSSWRRSGALASATVPNLAPASDACAAYELSWLRAPIRPPELETGRKTRIADLFAGAGGLSVGAVEACRSLGLRPSLRFAAELDESLLDRYVSNLKPEHASSEPFQDEIDGDLGEPLTSRESALLERVGRIDLMLAGPPCQGHSDLNNHTRRDDERNRLYLRAVRFAEIFEPVHVLIENVPGVVHDRRGVVPAAIEHLRGLGYSVDSGTLRAEVVGVPQRRRRFFILASRTVEPSVERVLTNAARDVRPVTWAIDDLGPELETPFGSSATHSAENRRRIAYLFAKNLYELPDSERPACHRDKAHSYKSVYGRMRPDEPAPTLTVGFGSTGQGRFVHPYRERTLTPHEAARIQTFPDWYDFGPLNRGGLQKAIGNAVPPLLAAAVTRDLLA